MKYLVLNLKDKNSMFLESMADADNFSTIDFAMNALKFDSLEDAIKACEILNPPNKELCYFIPTSFKGSGFKYESVFGV